MLRFRKGIALVFIFVFAFKLSLCIATISCESYSQSYLESIIAQLEIENSQNDEVNKLEGQEKSFISLYFFKHGTEHSFSLNTMHTIYDSNLYALKSKYVKRVSQPPERA